MRRFSVITSRCTLDLHCISVCLRDAIHPKPDEPGFCAASQLHIDPRQCIGCGACISGCVSNAIFEIGEVPEALVQSVEANAFYNITKSNPALPLP